MGAFSDTKREMDKLKSIESGPKSLSLLMQFPINFLFDDAPELNSEFESGLGYLEDSSRGMRWDSVSNQCGP